MGPFLYGVASGWIVALAYLAAGALVVRNAHDRPGLLPFSLFWFGVGGYGLVEGAWALSYLLGVEDMTFALAVLHLKIASISVGFAGLVAYLLLIYTGSPRAGRAAATYYLFAFLFTEAVYAMRDPVGQRVGTWGMQLVYASPSVEPYWTLMLLALMAPPLVAALAYGALLRHAEGPRRLRIALVSASLAAFFIPTLLAWQAGGLPWWGGVEKLLGALAAAGMIVAYRSTRTGEDAAWAERRKTRQAEARARVERRVSELI